MNQQAEEFGTEFVKDEIVSVDFSGDIKVVKGKNDQYQGKSVIIATGAEPRLAGFK